MNNQIASGLPLNHQTVLTQRPPDVLRILKTSTSGLSSAEASQRLLREGPNQIRERESRWSATLLRQFATPLVGLLVAASVISFILGETADALTVIGILVANGLLGFIQEFRSSQSLKTLARYLKSTATVRRDGRVSTIERSDLVPGDLVLLTAGDDLPADLRLITTSALRIDESTLTGESVEVVKSHFPLPHPTTALDACTNLAFAGSAVRHGQGEGIVIATGAQTVFGGIAWLVATTSRESTFEHNLKQFSTFLVKVVAVSLAIVFLVNILTKGPGLNLSEQMLFALALAISVIPEALPAVTTITLSRGALQLAKKHVVVKRLSAIEDLGHIDVLCTDKTGTLTENRPAVARLLGLSRQALLSAWLASIAPTIRQGAREAGDPFDAAVLEYARRHGFRLPAADILNGLPFDPERRRSSALVREGTQHRLVVLGAPETVVSLCRQGFNDVRPEQILDQAATLGQAGERTIAVAVREVARPLPTNLDQLEADLTYLGLISFVDPIKESSRKALLDAEHLGVEVKILTGDSPAVAGAVARKLGLIKSPLDVLTGDQLAAMPAGEYERTVRQTRVFARMTPQQKFDLIRTLETSSAVGFLGEGINDAPGLKLATVSLVVDRAADAARNAADIVLLDKSLHVIVDGIRQGRVIFENIQKYIKYTLVGNFGNFFAIAGISLTINYLPMLPVQILLTNILTDFPLVAVAGDAVDPKETRRPQQFRLRELGFLTLLLGLVSALFDFIFFGTFRTQTPATIQTLWFTASILSELLLIYSIRTRLPFERAITASASLIWLTVGAAAVAIILPFTDFGQSLFHFIQPSAVQLAIIAVIVVSYFIVTETVKQLYYRQYALHTPHSSNQAKKTTPV